MASCLGCPDMFETNSSNSVKDLFLILAEDASPTVSLMVKDLVEELHKQEFLEQIISEMVDLCLEKLGSVPAAASTPFNPFAPPAPVRSVLDDFTPPLAVLKILARSDKRVSKEITSLKHFLLDATLTSLPRNMNINNIHPSMLHNPQFLEVNGRKGVAVENKTILGQILRIAPNPTDPRLLQIFKDALKAPRNVLEGHVNDIRKRVAIAQSTAAELLLTILKAGGNDCIPKCVHIFHLYNNFPLLNSSCEVSGDGVVDPSYHIECRSREGPSVAAIGSIGWLLSQPWCCSPSACSTRLGGSGEAEEGRHHLLHFR